MSNCNICGRPRHIILSNKLVCMDCDEMLFDMEIEIDSPTPTAPRAPEKPKEKPAAVPSRPLAKVLKISDRKTTVKETKAETETEEDTDDKKKIA